MMMMKIGTLGTMANKERIKIEITSTKLNGFKCGGLEDFHPSFLKQLIHEVTDLAASIFNKTIKLEVRP